MLDTDHSFAVSKTGRDYDGSESVNKYLLVKVVESYIAVKLEANIICKSIKNPHVLVNAKTSALKSYDNCAVETTVLLWSVPVFSILASRHGLGNFVNSEFKDVDQTVLLTTTIYNN